MQHWTIQDVTLKAAFLVPFKDIYPFSFQYIPKHFNKQSGNKPASCIHFWYYAINLAAFLGGILTPQIASPPNPPFFSPQLGFGKTAISSLVKLTWGTSVCTAVNLTRFFYVYETIKVQFYWSCVKNDFAFNNVLPRSLNLSRCG